MTNFVVAAYWHNPMTGNGSFKYIECTDKIDVDITREHLLEYFDALEDNTDSKIDYEIRTYVWDCAIRTGGGYT